MWDGHKELREHMEGLWLEPEKESAWEVRVKTAKSPAPTFNIGLPTKAGKVFANEDILR